MLISRCAWHPFFRGYPRPLRVVSWRGPGVAFADTICRSCAERVRIEGLWASSPPTPVWPGSAQTALLFVGLPLLAALVLMATPLDEGTPLIPREEPSVSASIDEPLLEALAAEAESAPPPASPRAAVARPRQERSEPVPAVIYETRRVVAPRESATIRTSARPASGTTTFWRDAPLSPEPMARAVVVTRTGYPSSTPQSP